MDFKIFEVFNENGRRVFFTHDKSCIPAKEQINDMLKNKYKIKINGGSVTKKKLNESIRL